MAPDTIDIFDAPPAAAVASRSAPSLSLEPKADQPVVLHQQRAAAPAEVIDTGVDALIRVALQSGADVDRLERLYELKRKFEADEAQRAYTKAMSLFKKNAPQLFKDKHVKFQTDKGVTEYDHATLGAICEVVIEGLATYGISHSWDTKTMAQGGRVSVACVLEHEGGHIRRGSPLEADFDLSGRKNQIQAQGSAITYLERYTLLAAVGLAVKGMPDDDGKATQAADNAVALMTEKILDGLLEQIPATRTDVDAAALYRNGAVALKVTKNVEALNEFRQRVAEHRRTLAERGAS